MNLTTLKFNPNRNSPLHNFKLLYFPYVIAAGMVWILTGACISRVEAFTVNDVLPVMKETSKPPDEARKAVIKLIEELGSIITQDDELAKGLGLMDPSKPTPDKAPQLNLPDKTSGSMAVFYVNLKAIQDFPSPESKSDEPSKEDLALTFLAEDGNWSDLAGSLSPRRFLFPIVDANDQITSSVLVGLDKNKKDWNVLKFGSPRLTRALANFKSKMQDINYFAVDIRSLNRLYLGWIAGEELWLTAIVHNPGIDLTSQKPRRARDVFFALQKEARTIDRKNPAPR